MANMHMECHTGVGCPMPMRYGRARPPAASAWPCLLHTLGRRSQLLPRPCRAGARRDDVAPGQPLGPDSRLETPVPREQRPVNQLKELKESPLLTWVRWDHALYPRPKEMCRW